MKLFYGIVENNVDTEKLGRVQVRIVGKHTENRTDSTQQDYIPVADLPWAQTMQSGSVISNESTLFSVPKNGSVVICSFIDSDEQYPIVLGTVPKIPDTLPDFTQGFSDPNGVHPTSESLGVSPVSNYATGEPIPDSVTNKKSDVETGVTCVDQTWNEPETKFDPTYPDNTVIQNGDQVLELDDSEGKERINIQHKSGSFDEKHPNGDEVVKIKGTEYLIIEGNRNVLVKSGSNLTVQGALNMDAATTIKINAAGTLTITAATGTVTIDGLLTITASMISLN